MSVAEFSIRRPVTTIMCFVSLVVVGLIASFRLPLEALPDEPGLIVADGFGGAVVREAAPVPLAPARRKALTLAFARLGAMRSLRE